MKLLLGKWRLVLERASEPIVIVRQQELTERQMNEALADISTTHPLWLTIHQLIDTAERNAWDDAGARMENPQLQAGFVGAGKHFDLLRQDLHKRRRIGLKAEGK